MKYLWHHSLKCSLFCLAEDIRSTPCCNMNEHNMVAKLLTDILINIIVKKEGKWVSLAVE